MNAHQPQLNVSAGFAVPFVQTHLPNPERINGALRQLFLEREADRDYRRQSKTPTLQVEIFESEFDLFTWPQECVRKLRDFCMHALYLTIGQLRGLDEARLRKLEILNHCWFHVTRYGGYISSHNHPMASWSGVYCVDPGEPVEKYPDSGVLRFANPLPHANAFLDPANVLLQQPFSSGSLNYNLQPGQLVLFPSYLIHEVAPYYGEKPRITVAFNAWAKERSGQSA